MRVSLLSSILSPQHAVGDLEWPSDLLEFIEVEKKEAAPLWSPAVLAGTDRKKAAIQEISAVVLDFDGKSGGATDIQDTCLAFGDLEFVLHTTFSHTTDCPSYRVIFPLGPSLPLYGGPGEIGYKALWDVLAARAPYSDPSAHTPRRFYYGPSCRPGAPRLALHWPGDRRLSLADLPSAPAGPATPSNPSPPPRMLPTSPPVSSHVVTPGTVEQQGTGFFPE